MLNKPFSYDTFKEKLDTQHNFPEVYIFKFIVPSGKESVVGDLFPTDRTEELKERPSKGGNYISVTAKVFMESSDEVIALYKEAGKIEGIISL